MEKPHVDTTVVEVPADLASPALYRVDAAHHPRVDRAEMLRYLGYGGQQIEPELSRRIELVVERLELDIEPRGVRRVFAVDATGVDEQAGILLKNKEQEMASVILSLHAKQPKRGTVAFDKGYVEFYDYPRGQEAVITYTEDGSKETLRGGSTADALLYEVEDMERAIAGQGTMHLDYTRDVMRIMTDIRRQWGMTYPEEE